MSLSCARCGLCSLVLWNRRESGEIGHDPPARRAHYLWIRPIHCALIHSLCESSRFLPRSYSCVVVLVFVDILSHFIVRWSSILLGVSSPGTAPCPQDTERRTRQSTQGLDLEHIVLRRSMIARPQAQAPTSLLCVRAPIVRTANYTDTLIHTCVAQRPVRHSNDTSLRIIVR